MACQYMCGLLLHRDFCNIPTWASQPPLSFHPTNSALGDEGLKKVEWSRAGSTKITIHKINIYEIDVDIKKIWRRVHVTPALESNFFAKQVFMPQQSV